MPSRPSAPTAPPCGNKPRHPYRPSPRHGATGRMALPATWRFRQNSASGGMTDSAPIHRCRAAPSRNLAVPCLPRCLAVPCPSRSAIWQWRRHAVQSPARHVGFAPEARKASGEKPIPHQRVSEHDGFRCRIAASFHPAPGPKSRAACSRVNSKRRLHPGTEQVICTPKVGHRLKVNEKE